MSRELVLLNVPEEFHSERLVMAAARAGLGQALNAAICESLPDFQPWLSWADERPSVEDSEALVRKWQALFQLRQELRYQFFLKTAQGQAGRLIGACSLHHIDWPLRSFEIGYWLRSSAQGQGYMSEAVQALSDMAFESLRARRLEIRVDVRNVASRAVAERCGFVLEGVLRQSGLDVQGLPKDMCVYARLPSDPAPSRCL